MAGRGDALRSEVARTLDIEALVRMTGLELVRRCGCRVTIGSDNFYAWPHRVVVLTPEVAGGTDPHSLLIAAHEAAHDRQPRYLFWLRWLQPVRDHLEADAWRVAAELLKRFGSESVAV